MKNIVDYMLVSKTLRKDLDGLNSHRLYNTNKYRKNIDKLYKAITFKCNKKEFRLNEEDKYEQGVHNGTEHNEGTLRNRYTELGNVGYMEIFLAESGNNGLEFSYRWGYCSKIESIFTIKINNSLIYLSNNCEEQYIIADNHEIFKIINTINEECKKRLDVISNIIGKKFIDFERKVYDEENRISKIEQEKYMEKYIEDNLDKYLKS